MVRALNELVVQIPAAEPILTCSSQEISDAAHNYKLATGTMKELV